MKLRLTAWLLGLSAGGLAGWFLVPDSTTSIADTLPIRVTTHAEKSTASDEATKALADEILVLLEGPSHSLTTEAWQKIEAMPMEELRQFIRSLDRFEPIEAEQIKVLGIACERWATLDPKEFLQWFENESQVANLHRFRDPLFSFALERLLVTDHAAAVKFACDHKSPQNALSLIAPRLAAIDPDLLLKLPAMSGLHGQAKETVEKNVASALAAVDPRAAAEFCLTSARHATEDFLAVWGTLDPVATVEWLESVASTASEKRRWDGQSFGPVGGVAPRSRLGGTRANATQFGDRSCENSIPRTVEPSRYRGGR
jgi:hypothetical protein